MVSKSPRLDFEQWHRLAQRDPATFERRRKELIEALIARAPAARRPRLRGLQWRVDVLRRRAPNPLAACISLSDMMWETFAGSNGLLAALNGVCDSGETAPRAPRHNVLPLRRKRPGT